MILGLSKFAHPTLICTKISLLKRENNLNTYLECSYFFYLVMKVNVLTLVLLLIGLSACTEDVPDVLGDLLINFDEFEPLQLPDNQLTFTVGIYPTESLINNDFRVDHALQSAVWEDEETIVFTNILPGTYVIALANNDVSTDTPRRVIQIIADEVTVINFSALFSTNSLN